MEDLHHSELLKMPSMGAARPKLDKRGERAVAMNAREEKDNKPIIDLTPGEGYSAVQPTEKSRDDVKRILPRATEITSRDDFEKLSQITLGSIISYKGKNYRVEKIINEGNGKIY